MKFLYADQTLADPVNFERFSYASVPQCYALLDMAAMNQAGITPVQNYPTLQLKGQGVLIGFLDSGIDYTSRLFRNLDARQELPPSGIRRSRAERPRRICLRNGIYPGNYQCRPFF